MIREVSADIVGVIEAENHLTLARFTDSLLLNPVDAEPLYPHVMVIDGNDPRDIDVCILATKAYPLSMIRSHIDDGPFGNPVFSRDCPEYWFTFPTGFAWPGSSWACSSITSKASSAFRTSSTRSGGARQTSPSQFLELHAQARTPYRNSVEIGLRRNWQELLSNSLTRAVM